ncbi:MAG: hypothetical protein ACHQ17_01675 [Polyangia bacterium]
MVDEVMRQIRIFEELIKARLEVDVAGLVAGARARLESRLSLQPIPVDNDLADRVGPLGWGRVRTFAWEAPGFRKVVLTHVAMRPMIDGFALSALPSPKLAAPVFACDLMALPTRVSVNVDVYGAPELGASAKRAVLEPLGESFVRLGTGAGPAWAADLASGVGLHARVSPRAVDDAFGALTGALARYLEVAQTAQEGPGGPETQRAFFQAFHDHGPRKGALGRVMGAAWAERYSRLIFE